MKSHDLAKGSHDLALKSHDLAKGSHDLAGLKSHDFAKGSHDLALQSHDFTKAHMTLQKAHMILQGSRNLPFSAGSTPCGCMEGILQGQRSTGWTPHAELACQQLITSPSMHVCVHPYLF